MFFILGSLINNMILHVILPLQIFSLILQPEDYCKNYIICTYSGDDERLVEIFDYYINLIRVTDSLFDVILMCHEMFELIGTRARAGKMDKDLCLRMFDKISALNEACAGKEIVSMVETYDNYTVDLLAVTISHTVVKYLEYIYGICDKLTCDTKHLYSGNKDECSEADTCLIQSLTNKLYYDVVSAFLYIDFKEKCTKIPLATVDTLIKNKSYDTCPICMEKTISRDTNLGKASNCQHLFCSLCIYNAFTHGSSDEK